MRVVALVLATSALATSPRAAAPTREGAATVVAPEAVREADELLEELRRGLAGLRLTDTPAPYFGEVRLVRADLLAADGSYGGLVTCQREAQTSAVVDVRVGGRERDNTGFFGAENGGVRFEIGNAPAPELARRKLWLAMDRAFRGAASSYAGKMAVLAELAGDPPPPDFAEGPAKAVVELAPLQGAVGGGDWEASFDRARAAKLVRTLSSRFTTVPGIDNGDVWFQRLRSTELVVTTEGVQVAFARDRAVLAVTAEVQAKDGMRLDHGRAIHLQSAVYDARAVQELERRAAAVVDAVLEELSELRDAPLFDEEYDGPILFSGTAAAALLATTVATQAVGTPAPLSQGGRVVELEPAWLGQLGKTVLPAFIDLVDDPSAPGFGHYTRDAEGVLAERLVLVEGGKLRRLLMTRTPNQALRTSHGRARMTPSLVVGPAISNLVLRSRKPGLSSARLEQDLLRRAREDGYDFAYVVAEFRDAAVLGPVPRDSAEVHGDGRKLALPVPTRVYRIDASGKRTLVRGALFAPVSMRALRRIRAVGQESHVVPLRIPVGVSGGFGAEVGVDGVLSQTVDVEVTTPDLLLEGLELVLERGEHERPPTLVHPLRRAHPPAPSSKSVGLLRSGGALRDRAGSGHVIAPVPRRRAFGRM